MVSLELSLGYSLLLPLNFIAVTMPSKPVLWNDNWMKNLDSNDDKIGDWARRESDGKAACK